MNRDTGVGAAIFELATYGCKARVVLDTKAVPPNPIRSFEPVS